MTAVRSFSSLFLRRYMSIHDKTVSPVIEKLRIINRNCQNRASWTVPSRCFHVGKPCFATAKRKLQHEKTSTKMATKLLKTPVDDVYLEDLYEPKQYELSEAITTLKRYTELDFSDPDSLVLLKMGIHPAPMKKGKLQPFFMVEELPNEFEYQNKICVFSDNADVIKEALEEGAVRAGGDSVIQEIKFGDTKFDAYVTTFEYSKAKILGNQELTRAIGKLVPRRKHGITDDIIGTLREYRDGTIITNLSQTEKESTVVVGRINQTIEEISENIEKVMDLIREQQNPKHPPIIQNASLSCCSDDLDLIMEDDLDD